MASLQKIGKYYYGRWQKITETGREDVRKSLGIKYKPQAKEALEKLEKLEETEAINPYSSNFDPKTILKEQKQKKEGLGIHTVREAADYFYKKKSHLSNASVNSDKDFSMNTGGAYERVIEFFIKKNDIADLSPRLVQRQHFENVIFRDVKPATMGFYFRTLRAWWNKLLEWNIVETNYPAMIKSDIPAQKDNVREKMMTERELEQLFETFDDDLKKKRKQKHWNDGLAQHWFKPLIAVYFYCGLRKHEAAFSSDLSYSGLKRQNIYFENDLPVLIELSATKGQTERSVPIPEACQRYLKPYLVMRGDLKYDDYIFVYNGTRRKGFPVTGARVYREFKRYLKMARLPGTRSIHGMRHQFVTSSLEDGFSTSEVQFMAGHSNVKTTENYTHLTGKGLLKKMRRLKREKGDGDDV
jgi:site-specific recombinase XerD